MLGGLAIGDVSEIVEAGDEPAVPLDETLELPITDDDVQGMVFDDAEPEAEPETVPQPEPKEEPKPEPEQEKQESVEPEQELPEQPEEPEPQAGAPSGFTRRGWRKTAPPLSPYPDDDFAEPDSPDPDSPLADDCAPFAADDARGCYTLGDDGAYMLAPEATRRMSLL